jgi:hypothetical protein
MNELDGNLDLWAGWWRGNNVEGVLVVDKLGVREEKEFGVTVENAVMCCGPARKSTSRREEAFMG